MGGGGRSPALNFELAARLAAGAALAPPHSRVGCGQRARSGTGRGGRAARVHAQGAAFFLGGGGGGDKDLLLGVAGILGAAAAEGCTGALSGDDGAGKGDYDGACGIDRSGYIRLATENKPVK